MLTVFTSCYNQAQWLGQAIESVLNQTYEDFEYHLIDAGSDDYTLDVINYYSKKDSRITSVYQDEEEPLNAGFCASASQLAMKGEAWVWMPADDILMPNMLETKVLWAKQFPNTVST